ncbi:MAG: 23S rRNA (uracil(1939)-C(5))-methyltransferase RlmD [Oscillospiraceae bacterium]|nr:23S rRNA (uracil(1939)-C(5))-methyltransferase RlmD [Oscillospiraceae bacterium]
MNLKKNQIVLLDITGMSHEGDGIGRHRDGMAVFVPMSAPGDRLSVRIAKVLSNRAYGIIEEIIAPSPDRCENLCEAYRTCGGCSLRHITPEAEMRIKNGLVQDNLGRIGKIEIGLEEPIDSRCGRYRNKASYPVQNIGGRVTCGMYARRSHRLVKIRDCLLQPALFADITACVCDFCNEFSIPAYDEETHTGLLRHIVIRHAEKTDQTMVSLVINGKSIPHIDILAQRLRVTTLILDHNTRKTNVIGGQKQTVICGGGYIVDKLGGIEIEISPGSFYQVNRGAAELLYAKALEYAAPEKSDTLLDLYCGTGAVGLSMAHAVKEVIGVEIIPQAVRDAGRNAERNNIENARFICADAGGAALKLAEEGIRPDIVVLDPPRAGIDAQTVKAVCSMAPGRIVYISCNSATQARDCAVLCGRGYTVTRGCAVNLFPRTAHAESVLLLTKTSRDITTPAENQI